MSWVPLDSLSYTITAINATTANMIVYSLSAGFTVSEFVAAGYGPSVLLNDAGFTLPQVRGALNVVSIRSILALGGIYTLSYLRTTGGYTATECKAATFTATELYTAGYSYSDLKTAGYTATEVKAAGASATNVYTVGYTVTEALQAAFSVSALRTAGYTSTQLHTAGVSGSDLVGAGFNLNDLKTAGFTATECKALGYTALELKTVGFSLDVIYAASYSAADILQAGFTLAQLKTAGYFTTTQLMASGSVSLHDLYVAGYSVTEMRAIPNVTPTQLQQAGYSGAALKQAGYTMTQLLGPFTLSQLRGLGFTATEGYAASFSTADMATVGGYPLSELKTAGYPLSELKLYFSLSALKTAGYTASALKTDGGFSLTQLQGAGFTLAELVTAGFTAAQQYAAGLYTTLQLKPYYTLSQLIEGGFTSAAGFVVNGNLVFTVTELRTALSFTATQFHAAGVRPSDLVDAGFTYAELHTAGYTASELYTTNATASQMRAAGYTATDLYSVYTVDNLRTAGYLITEIRTAGYTDAQCVAAGFTASLLHTNGYTASQVRVYGFPLSEVQAAGYSDYECITAGYSIAEYAANSFTAYQMRTLGSFSATQLVALFSKAQMVSAGYSASNLREVGFSLTELQAAQYSAVSLLTAGFSVHDLRLAGYTVSQLRTAGYSVNDMRTEFSFSQLYTGGYTTTELLANKAYTAIQIRTAMPSAFTAAILRANQYTAAECKSAGFTDVLTAGFTATELRLAGYTLAELSPIYKTDVMNAGFTMAQIKAAGFTAYDARRGPYTAEQMYTAGYSLSSLLSLQFPAADLRALNVSLLDLKANGYTPAALLAGGYLDYDILNAGYSADLLRAAGYSVEQLKTQANYTAQQARDGGYSDAAIVAARFLASDLSVMGIAASLLYSTGYTISELVAGLYTTSQIVAAGYSASELRTNNLKSDQLRAYGSFTIAQLRTAGYGTTDIMKAGYTASVLRVEGGYSAVQLMQSGSYPVANLKQGGYSDADIVQAGYPAEALRLNGYTATQLQLSGQYTIMQLLAAYYATSVVLQAGFPASQWKAIPVAANVLRPYYTVAQLRGVYTDTQIAAAGYSASDLYAAGGFTIPVLYTYYTPVLLLQGGYSKESILYANVYSWDVLRRSNQFTIQEIMTYPEHPPSIADLLSSGYSVAVVATASFSAADLHNNGSFSTTILRSAGGYSIAELVAGGFSRNSIIAAGYSAADFYNSPSSFTVQELATQYSASDLRTAGFSDSDIVQTFEVSQLKQAGYSLSDVLAEKTQESVLATGPLLRTSYFAQDWYDLSTRPSVETLVTAGYTLADIVSGYPSSDVLPALRQSTTQLGFSWTQLRTQGNFTVNEFRNIGLFSCTEARQAGYPLQDVKDVYTDTEVIEAGYNAYLLRTVGGYAASALFSSYSALQLRTAGYQDTEILELGYSAADLSLAKFTVSEMQNYGYNDTVILSGLSTVTELVPSAPVIDRVEIVPGGARVHLSDTLELNLGHIFSLDQGATYQWAPATSGNVVEINGLQNGQTYSNVLIRSVNGAHQSPATMLGQPIVPQDVPDVPVLCAVTGADRQLQLTFLNGKVNGSYYTTPMIVELQKPATGEFLQVTVPELGTPVADEFVQLTLSAVMCNGFLNTDDVFAITLQTRNALGLSRKSNVVQGTMKNVPSPPVLTAADPGDRQITLHYTEGNLNGGGAIFLYQFSVDNGVNWYNTLRATSSVLLVNGYPFVNGTTYSIMVRAYNRLGISNASAPIQCTPCTIPSRPIITTTSVFYNRIDIVYVLESNGGSAPVSYAVSLDNGATFPYTIPADTTTDFTLSLLFNEGLPVLSAGQTSYSTQIKVINTVGSSDPSVSVETVSVLVPSPPIVTDIQAGFESCTVTFTQPTDEVVTHYTYSVTNQTHGTTSTGFVSKNTSPVQIYGLINSRTYVLQLAAVNRAGTSSFSPASLPFTPFSFPDPPVITKVEPNNNKAKVYFEQVVGNGAPVSGIKYFNGSSFVDLVGGITSPLMIPNLVNKESYPISIAAVNAGGISRTSNALAVRVGTLLPPIITRLESSGRAVNVYFTQPPPSDNGDVPALLYYLVSYDNGKTYTRATTTSSPITVSKLTNGVLYTFLLMAVNANGYHIVPSNAMSAYPYGPPTKPTIRTVTPQYLSPATSSAVVQFIPSDFNGAEITSYKWALSTQPTVMYTADLSTDTVGLCTIGPLPMNTSYSIVLYAQNAGGLSAASAVSRISMFKYTVASAPRITNTVVNASTGAVTLSFVKPSENGSPISSYAYRLNESGSFHSVNSNMLPMVIPSSAIPKNQAFTLQVVAINELGESPPSLYTKSTVYVYLPPGVAKITRVLGQNQALWVYFTPGTLKGAPILGYDVYVNNTVFARLQSATTSSVAEELLVVPNVTNDQRYSVAISAATETAGSSTLSNVVMGTPVLKAPEIPLIASVDPKNHGGKVLFKLSNDNGSVVTGIKYRTAPTLQVPQPTEYYSDTWTCALSDMSATAPNSYAMVAGFTNDVAYTIQIAVENAIGISGWSKGISLTPAYKVPSAPVITSLGTGVRYVKVAFRASLPNGGTIDNYFYELNGSDVWIACGLNNGSFNISYLTPGGYSIRMMASNELGRSGPSNAMSCTISTIV